MSNIMNDLHTIGLNPFAVQLLAESVLKSPVAPMTVGKPQGFFFPINRSDCAGWVGVRITIEAVPQEQSKPQHHRSCALYRDGGLSVIKDSRCDCHVSQQEQP